MLLDSNVLIAAIVGAHRHNAASLALVERFAAYSYVSAHSWAEVYNTLTKRGAGWYNLSPVQAGRALAEMAAATKLVGLTPEQTVDAIHLFSRGGGIGARLYDYLIGHAAVVHGIQTIVTWNTGHMRALFPALRVATPDDIPG